MCVTCIEYQSSSDISTFVTDFLTTLLWHICLSTQSKVSNVALYTSFLCSLSLPDVITYIWWIFSIERRWVSEQEEVHRDYVYLFVCTSCGCIWWWWRWYHAVASCGRNETVKATHLTQWNEHTYTQTHRHTFKTTVIIFSVTALESWKVSKSHKHKNSPKACAALRANKQNNYKGKWLRKRSISVA